MRFLIKIAFVLIILFILSCQYSCEKIDSFLDQKVSTALNEEVVFADSARTLDFLSGIYSDLNFWHDQPYDPGTPTRSLTGISGESDGRYPSAGMLENNVSTGSYGGDFSGWLSRSWTGIYSQIRSVNIFLENVDNFPLSNTKKNRTRAEARFLRAYYYSLLMKGWGGVPIVRDTIYDLNSFGNIKRNSYSECVNYVVTELDDIKNELPISYSGLDYGRITRGACLALKGRVLLFAASPLFNGGSIASDEELVILTAYPSADNSRWNLAFEALKEVVDMDVYELEIDNETKDGYGFYNLFQERINREYILTYMMGPNQTIEQFNLPPSRANWDGYNRFPTQEIVDAFPMKNGLHINASGSGYDENNPYADRDPRFYYSIIYNGALFYRKQSRTDEPVYTYKNSGSDAIVDISSGAATHTGYYWRKMMNDQMNYNSGALSDRCLPIMRYGGILLDYAEAANEIGETAIAMEQLIKIRKRAGIEPGTNQRYGLPSNPTKDEAREIIHNERFIELAFEGNRFWDIRRWKKYDLLQDKYTHGMMIEKKGDDYSYDRIQVRYFQGLADKFYLFPINQDEIAVNRNILQNPGW